MSNIFLIDYLSFISYENYMATKKPQILLTVDEILLKRIEDFRFEKRINTRSEAIRRLLDESLKKYEREVKK